MASGAGSQVWMLTCQLNCRLTYHASLILLLCWMMSALPPTFAHAEHDGSFSLEVKNQTDKSPWHNITVPYILEGRKKRNITDTGLKFEHPERMEIVLEVNGETVVLLLERNKYLIPPHFKVGHNGSTSMDDFNHRTHCFYHGTVRGQNDSIVAVSTCHRLRGRIVWNGVSYSIAPLEESMWGEHLVFKLEDLNTSGLGCGVVHENVTHFEELPSLPFVLRKKRAILTDTTRWVELVLVVGATLYQQRYQSNRSKMIGEITSVVNIVDSDYKRINIRVVLVGLHVMTTVEQALVVKEGDTAGSVVGRFASWRQTNYNILGRNDCGHLMTWETFGGVLGMAYVGTICSRSSAAGFVAMASMDISTVAAVVAHEMGHNLGMSHDRSPCACSPACIMNAALPSPLSTSFSQCSTNDFESLILGQRGGSCLLNVPIPSEEFRQPVCGDGIVDKGEACDCGTAQQCTNPCCEASTCQLKGNAECAYGLCCTDCKIVGQGEICRPSVGFCDLPEYCNGSSQFCYADTFIQNGYPCQNNAAYCYNGICLTLDYQCQHIWGGNAISGSDQCYTIVNTMGDQFGNCGQNPSGSYKVCTMANVKCGKLVCQNTPTKPLIVDAPNFGSFSTCNAVSFNYGSDIPDPGLVQAGTKCGNDSVCMNNECQNATVVLGTLCDTDTKCNGQGVCNNNLNCDCFYGYAPPDCSSRGYGGSIESGNSYKPPSKLLWLLLLLFVPVIAGGAYFYWSRHGGGRRSRRKKPRTAHPQGIPNNSAPAASNAHNQRPPTVAVITPGNPPARPPPPPHHNSAANDGYQPHNAQSRWSLPDVTRSVSPARPPPVVPSAPNRADTIDPKPELPTSTISPVRSPPAIPSGYINTGYDNNSEVVQPPNSNNAARINPVRPPPAVPNAGVSTDVSYVSHHAQSDHVVMLGNLPPGWKPNVPPRPKNNA